MRRLREQYFCSLLKQEVSFFDTLPTGEVSSQLSEDLEAIQTGTSEKVGLCISSFSYFVTAYIVAFTKSARLAGILVSLIPAYFIMAISGGYLVKKYSGRASNHAAAAMSIASESLSNMTIVHAFTANVGLETVFAKRLSDGQMDGLKKSVFAAMQLGLLYFISFSANALAFWQGGREIAEAVDEGNSDTTVGAVYTVIFLLVDGKKTS